MKIVIQRVLSSTVEVDKNVVASIDKGLAVLFGAIEGDSKNEAEFLAKKMCELRIFEDDNNKMNLSLLDVGGDILVVSQFTLSADCSHGRRPSFIRAQKPQLAKEMYEYFVKCTEDIICREVKTGIFGADMKFSIENDGPVTIILDTDEIMK